ncbi:MAG: radical SAM protein [Patescibacteria group bacterium]
MKVLLLVPPTSLDLSYGNLKNFSDPNPSIGLAYIAAVLQKNGFEVVVTDGYVNQLDLGEVMKIVEKERPDIIGISMLTTAAGVAIKIVEEVRKNFPAIKIVMGNIHASLFAKDLLKDGHADYIVHREGEYTMLELAQSLRDNNSVEGIRGLSYLSSKGEVINNELRHFIENLDDLPFPAWDLFPLDKYKTDPRTEMVFGKIDMFVLATRGCPNVCTFCSSSTDKSQGNRYRMRDPKKVVDELEYLNKKYGATVFTFIDLAFPLVKSHGMALCQEIIDRGLAKKIQWSSELRVKPLDQEMLNIMKKSGCRRVIFGIESGTDRILEICRKNFNIDDVKRAVKMAKKANLEVDGMFMIGLPTETVEDIERTINFAIKLNVRYAILNLFVPYPGCEFYETLNRDGKIKFKDWSDFISYPTYAGREPVYVPDGLTREQLMHLQTQAMKKFYFRPSFIFGELKRFRLSKIKHYWRGLIALILVRR